MTRHSCIPLEEGLRGLIFGASGSGKTHLLVEMLLSPALLKGHFDDIYFVSPAFFSNTQDAYKKLKVPRSHVITEWDQDWILEKVDSNKMRRDPKTNKLVQKKILLVIDDVTGVRGVRTASFAGEESPLSKVFTKGRHHGASIIGLFHQVKAVDPVVRKNANFVVAFHYWEGSEEKAICETMGLTYCDEFIDLYRFSCGIERDKPFNKHGKIICNREGYDAKHMIYNSEFKGIDITEFLFRHKKKKQEPEDEPLAEDK